MAIIPAFRKLRQKDHKLETSLDNIVRPISKKKKRNVNPGGIWHEVDINFASPAHLRTVPIHISLLPGSDRTLPP
jgi:hypothetical protein